MFRDWTGQPLTSLWVWPTQGVGTSPTSGSHTGTLVPHHGLLRKISQLPPVLILVWYGVGSWEEMSLIHLRRSPSKCWQSIWKVLYQLKHWQLSHQVCFVITFYEPICFTIPLRSCPQLPQAHQTPVWVPLLISVRHPLLHPQHLHLVWLHCVYCNYSNVTFNCVY